MGTALRVALCESKFDPTAYSSGNAGVYQHAVRYWAMRARSYGLPGASVFNGRANVIVTMRMVKGMGWYPWSCY